MVISQPHVPGLTSIPGTLDEIESIQRCVKNLSWLDQEHTSLEKVVDSLNDHNVVHLACHGIQDNEDPLKSAFILADVKLTLEDLIKKDLKNADLAFLSACQTATGDLNRPEEVVHLAAEMLSASYKSVIGTMSPIGDKDASIIAEAFYSKLIENDDKGWMSGIAQVFHHASKHLRDEIGEDNFLKWIPFVHFGQ